MAYAGSLSQPGWESTVGEKHRNCKITNDQVRAIRKDIGKPEEIALKYGVTAGYVMAIKRGKVRKGVK
jgi:hypothetical protein